MTDKFIEAIDIVLVQEGGFVNHPKDPGGATNFGVTQSVYEAFIGKKVTVNDIKNMKKSDVYPIYQACYWNKIQGDKLKPGVDLVVLDFAVNAGVFRAITYMQKAIGVTADGVLGPKTLAAINSIDAAEFINKYSTLRENFYKSLKTFPTFGRGWLARVNHIKDLSLKRSKN